MGEQPGTAKNGTNPNGGGSFMGDNQQTTTQTNAPSNPDVNPTVSRLLQGVQAAQNKGPQVFQQSLYAGAGPTTQSAWQNTLNASNNPAFTGAVNKGLGYAGSLAGGSGPSLTEQNLSGVANGNYLNGGDPFFEANLAKTLNETSSGINAGLGASGRLGSNLQLQSLSEGLGNVSNAARSQQYQTERDRQVQALGAIEGQRQQGVSNAFAAQAALPGLYQAGLLPSQVQGQVGAAQDADKQAALQGQYDLYSRNANADTDLLAKLSSILAGNAQAGGTTQTTTQPGQPWWQTLGGAAVGLGSLLL
jgi:hypothetical protein